MTDFSKNKWKYSTMGLIAVLVVGFSFPQAFAATKDIASLVSQILTIVTNTQSDVNDMPSKIYGSKVISANPAIDTFDSALATSDRDFTVCYTAVNTNELVSATFSVQEHSRFGTGPSLGLEPKEKFSACVGGQPGDKIVFRASNQVLTWITLITSEDANASITDVDESP